VKKKLVCLSSGSEVQYRLDILRVMAMPEGAEIQFRYDTDLIDPTILTGLADDTLHKSPVLLAYLDLTAPIATPGGRAVQPCRHAVLINSEQLGKYVVLRFRLGAFSDCADIVALRALLAPKSPRSKDGKYEGFWVFENDFGKACLKSNEMALWQSLMKDLAGSADFASEDFFFRVMGLYRRGEDEAMSPSKGEYELKASTEYEWKVFHFHPESDAHKLMCVSTVIKVASASEDIKAVTSPLLAIDSSYDLKSFHFRTDATTATTYAAFTVKFEDATAVQGTQSAVPSTHPELFLPVRIVPSSLWAAFSVVVLTALLFGQQYISAISKGGIPHHTSIVLLVLAFITALFAVYALKKPL
jgi:hypothetical protein